MISHWLGIALISGALALMSIASFFYEHGDLIQTVIMK